MSFLSILRGTIFSIGGITAILIYFPKLGILTFIYLLGMFLRNKTFL